MWKALIEWLLADAILRRNIAREKQLRNSIEFAKRHRAAQKELNSFDWIAERPIEPENKCINEFQES